MEQKLLLCLLEMRLPKLSNRIDRAYPHYSIVFISVEKVKILLTCSFRKRYALTALFTDWKVSSDVLMNSMCPMNCNASYNFDKLLTWCMDQPKKERTIFVHHMFACHFENVRPCKDLVDISTHNELYIPSGIMFWLFRFRKTDTMHSPLETPPPSVIVFHSIFHRKHQFNPNLITARNISQNPPSARGYYAIMWTYTYTPLCNTLLATTLNDQFLLPEWSSKMQLSLSALTFGGYKQKGHLTNYNLTREFIAGLIYEGEIARPGGKRSIHNGTHHWTRMITRRGCSQASWGGWKWSNYGTMQSLRVKFWKLMTQRDFD